MHDIRWIRDNAEALKAGLRRRGWDGLKVEETVAELFRLDDARRDIIAVTQRGQEERNRLSKEVGQAMGKKDFARAEELKARVAQIKAETEGAAAAETAAVQALEKFEPNVLAGVFADSRPPASIRFGVGDIVQNPKQFDVLALGDRSGQGAGADLTELHITRCHGLDDVAATAEHAPVDFVAGGLF
jgi:hypothetical protein